MSAEVASRIANDSAETLARTTADASLQSQIDFITSNVDATALDSLTEIVAAFQTADGNINNAISTLSLAAGAGLDAEIARATAAELKLTNDLAAEKSRAESAEGVLQSNITTENLRAIANEIVVGQRVNDEQAARIAADDILGTTIETETQRRRMDDEALTLSLATEVARAQAMEVALSAVDNMISLDLNDEINRANTAEIALATSIAAETTARITADAVVTAAFTAADVILQSNINTEKGRIDAILSASTANADSFKEIVDLINSVDTSTGTTFAGYVTQHALETADAKTVATAYVDFVAAATALTAANALAASDLADSQATAAAKLVADAAMDAETASRIAGDLANSNALTTSETANNAAKVAAKAIADAALVAAKLVADAALVSAISTSEAADAVKLSDAIAASEAADAIKLAAAISATVSTIPRKYTSIATSVGNATAVVFTHGLNNSSPVVSIKGVLSGAVIELAVDTFTANGFSVTKNGSLMDVIVTVHG